MIYDSHSAFSAFVFFQIWNSLWLFTLCRCVLYIRSKSFTAPLLFIHDEIHQRRIHSSFSKGFCKVTGGYIHKNTIKNPWDRSMEGCTSCLFSPCMNMESYPSIFPNMSKPNLGEQFRCWAMMRAPGSEVLGPATDFDGLLGPCCIESVLHLLIKVSITNGTDKLRRSWHSIHVPGPIASLGGMRRSAHLVACKKVCHSSSQAT